MSSAVKLRKCVFHKLHKLDFNTIQNLKLIFSPEPRSQPTYTFAIPSEYNLCETTEQISPTF